MFLKVLLTVSYMLILTVYSIYTYRCQKSQGGQFLSQKYSEFHIVAFVMVITKEEVRNTTKAKDHKPGLGAALGASPCWWTPLLSGAPRGSAQQPVIATSVSRRSQQPRLFCPQSSCHTQFIKMITQATAGKLGAWNLPRLIHNALGSWEITPPSFTLSSLTYKSENYSSLFQRLHMPLTIYIYKENSN